MEPTSKTKPKALVILDGFGYSANTDHNAITEANMLNFNSYFNNYPHALLQASGASVGLLPGMIGNSAVGHLTIGAGRIIDQPITALLKSISDKIFFKNPEIFAQLKELKISGKTLHIIGLLSDAGVHCHTDIIKACIELAQQVGVKKIVVHPILDGRDAPPQSAETYLAKLEKLTRSGVRIGTIQGRFYAMDRNNNWDRTNAAYAILTSIPPKSCAKAGWRTALHTYYAQDITDEFIPPTHLDSDSTIMPGDGIIFCNIRADRARQLTQLLMQSPTAWIITGIPYFADQGLHLFTPTVLTDTLLDKLSQEGKTIFTCAESEKYAHISYFFKGGKEALLPGETRVIIPSYNPQTFISHPEMCAPEITSTVLKSLRTDPCDFYLINYANPDMVGHSGDLQATIKALQCIDEQLKLLYDEIVVRHNGTLYITSDHGKAEQLWDPEQNQPYRAHTTNPVPFVMVRHDLYHTQLPQKLTTLADIAPLVTTELEKEFPLFLKL